MPHFSSEEGKMDECYLVAVSKLSEAISVSVSQAKTVWGVHLNFHGKVRSDVSKSVCIRVGGGVSANRRKPNGLVESTRSTAARKHNGIVLLFLQVPHFWRLTRKRCNLWLKRISQLSVLHRWCKDPPRPYGNLSVGALKLYHSIICLSLLSQLVSEQISGLYVCDIQHHLRDRWRTNNKQQCNVAVHAIYCHYYLVWSEINKTQGNDSIKHKCFRKLYLNMNIHIFRT